MHPPYLHVLEGVVVQRSNTPTFQLEQSGGLASMHKRTRRGGRRGGNPPQLWRNLQKSAPFGQMFALNRAKMLANNGLCVGQPP